MPKSARKAKILKTSQANLKALIDHSELSVNAWAVKFNLAQSTINRIVSGKQDMTSAKMQEIAAAANFPAYYLLIPDFVPSNPPMLNGQSDIEKKLYAKIQSALAQLETLRDHNTGPGDLLKE